MGKESKIGWTNATYNPFWGCHKISEGCRYCYAERLMSRYDKIFRDIQKTSDKTFNAPLTWKDPKMIFTCSLSDFFLPEADTWRPAIWDIIKKTPQHTYQILTKRPERILQCLPPDWDNGYTNVWLGVSAENQKRADERIPILLSIPAFLKWISAEPLLESINLSAYITNLQWVVVGGESGYDFNFSECKIQWIEDVINQCQKNNVPVFVKQLGCYLKIILGLKDWKGEDINEFPLNLRIRQFPESTTM